MLFQNLFDQFFQLYSRVPSGFLMQAADFLELFPSSRRIPVFEAAILSYKQKVRIFETPSIQNSGFDLQDKSFICTKFQTFNP